jgi:hypothetical protein
MTHMPFGKHKGSPLRDLPDKYVMWLLEQDYVQGQLRAALNHLCCNPPNRTPGGSKVPTPKVDADEMLRAYLKGITLKGFQATRELVKDNPERMKLLQKARELIETTFDL